MTERMQAGKALAVAMLLALVMGLCPGLAFAAADGDNNAAPGSLAAQSLAAITAGSAQTAKSTETPTEGDAPAEDGTLRVVGLDKDSNIVDDLDYSVYEHGDQAQTVAKKKIAYNPKTNTLTLNGYTASKLRIDARFMGNGFTIRVKGTNSIQSIQGTGDLRAGPTSINIEGTGTLNIDADYGIKLYAGFANSGVYVGEGVSLNITSAAGSGADESTDEDDVYHAIRVYNTTAPRDEVIRIGGTVKTPYKLVASKPMSIDIYNDERAERGFSTTYFSTKGVAGLTKKAYKEAYDIAEEGQDPTILAIEPLGNGKYLTVLADPVKLGSVVYMDKTLNIADEFEEYDPDLGGMVFNEAMYQNIKKQKSVGNITVYKYDTVDFEVYAKSSDGKKVYCGYQQSLEEDQGTVGFWYIGTYEEDEFGSAYVDVSKKVKAPSVAGVKNTILHHYPQLPSGYTATVEQSVTARDFHTDVMTLKVKGTGATNVANATVSAVKARAYTGKELKPKPKVTLDGTTLKRGTDYTLKYKKNVEAGKASIVIKGKGSYSGTKTVKFKIVQAKNTVKAAKVKVSKTLSLDGAKKLASAKTVKLPKVSAKFGKAKWVVVAKDKKKALSLKAGKVKVKKGAKRGTYTMKLKAKVAKTVNYKAASTKVVTVKVKVK